jgi:hypothetical protein
MGTGRPFRPASRSAYERKAKARCPPGLSDPKRAAGACVATRAAGDRDIVRSTLRRDTVDNDVTIPERECRTDLVDDAPPLSCKPHKDRVELAGPPISAVAKRAPDDCQVAR